MVVSNFYILTEEQYQKLISGQAQHHELDVAGWYHTDKIPADLIDDTNSTKHFVTSEDIARWNSGTTPVDWEQDDSTAVDFIKNKPVWVADVLISTDGETYTSIVDSNRIANLDLSSYIKQNRVKTVNGQSIIGEGNIPIQEITFIDCRTSLTNLPTQDNTSGKLRLVLLTQTTAQQVGIHYNGYIYRVIED